MNSDGAEVRGLQPVVLNSARSADSATAVICSGRQRTYTVRQDERQTLHAGKQLTVRSGRTIAYITSSAWKSVRQKSRFLRATAVAAARVASLVSCPHPPHVSATCQCQLTVAATSGHIKVTPPACTHCARCPRQCALPSVGR